MNYKEWRNQLNNRIDEAFYYFCGRVRFFVCQVGELSHFGWLSVSLYFTRPFRFRETIIHMEFIGNKSIGIIVLSGLFTGMALAYQIFIGFALVNATSLVGPTVGLGVSRELGPVLTGLIVSARAGGAMAARIGTMRVTEQIDALEVMGVHPLQYLVSPRIVASVIVMPLLTGVFIFMAMMGCWFVCIPYLGMDEAQFWDRTLLWLQPYHIFEGLFKAAIFGLGFAIICSHRGYTTTGGASGVGSSTNRGVVLSMLLIIVSDFFITNLINAFYHVKAAFIF